MAALRVFLLEVFALRSTPFAVCLICWVEVRGYQCHVSENIKPPHSLSLLVCVEISSLGWVYSPGSGRVEVKAQGAVTQNCVFCKITCMAAFSLWNTPAQQGKKQWKLYKQQVCAASLNPQTRKKLSQTTHPFEVYWASFSHLHALLPLV